MEINQEMLSKFGGLNNTDTCLAEYLGKDKSLEDIINGLHISPKDVGPRIYGISDKLGIPYFPSLHAQMQAVGEVQRRYKLRQEEKTYGAPVASLPHKVGGGSSVVKVAGDPDEDLEDMEQEMVEVAPPDNSPALSQTDIRRAAMERARAKRTGQPKLRLDQVRLPGMETMIRGVDKLSINYIDTLRELSQVPHKKMGHLARHLEVQPVSLSNRLKKISEKLGIPTGLDLKDVRDLLRSVWNSREEALAQKLERRLPPKPVEEEVPVPAPEVPAPTHHEVVASAMPVSIPARVVEEVTPHLPQSLSPAQPQHASVAYGPAVVINLPEGVTDIDVVSGIFNGGAPSRDMAEEVRERKERGLAPMFLVLSPNGVDPTTTLAQVVFLERDKKS